jgi:hypothetical protein
MSADPLDERTGVAGVIEEIRSMPCSSCPYRRDVPSGVWAHSEYQKLRDYDAPTGDQPFAAFACHASPEVLCHGWAVVHSNRGHQYDLLALRLMLPHPKIPPAGVPLFGSGNEAADHGQRDIEAPGAEARRTTDRLLRKYERLRTEEP